MMFYPQERLALFIDGANLYSAARALGFDIDYKRLLTLFQTKGRLLRAAKWPHDPVDFAGKRVGVVGTGSTGIQAIPVIASQAKHLTVFQRTANYSIPARNAPLTEEFKQYAKTHTDEIRKIMNSNTNAHPFYIKDRSVFDVSDEEREQIFESAWKKGGLAFRAEFRDTLLNDKANQLVADFICKKIRDIVKNPVTAELLAGWGYASMRFDFRGCGDSEGPRARVICLEQVEDTSNALTFLAKHPSVDPDRIGVIAGGRLIAQGTLDELRLKAGKGDTSLEDTFLTLVAEEVEAA